MAKLAAEALTDLTIKALKSKNKPYNVRDGNGLFLLVHPNGSKYFQLRTTLHGKAKLIQLGTYPSLSVNRRPRLSTNRRPIVSTFRLIEHCFCGV